MLPTPMGRRIALGLLLGALVFSGGPAYAQGQLAVRISDLQNDSFPTLWLYASILDGSGRRVPGLPVSAFSVREDGIEVPANEVEEVPVGTRQVFVLDTTAAMGVRDSRGRTRFDFVRTALLEWWRGPLADTLAEDDLTLVTSEGVLISHSGSTAELAAALTAFEPTYPERTPDLVPLLDAFTLLAEPGPRPGMPASVIFATAGLPQLAPAAMENALFRARISHASVYFVIAPEAPSAGSDPLSALAQETGGSRLVLDPEVGLASLAQLILGQRTQYRLSYTSRVQFSGEHEVQLVVSAVDRVAESPVRTFAAEVLPPVVTFVQPPLSILRTSTDPTLGWDSLPPTSQTLRVLITFPDRHPRPVTHSQLLVDGEVLGQNLEPPFEQFEWPLSVYPASGQHVVQAVVSDSLGLQGSTEALPVEVQVRPAPGGLAALRRTILPLAAALVLLVLGVGTATRILSLGSASRTPPRPAPAREPKLRRAGIRLQPQHDPEAWLVIENGAPPTAEPFALGGLDVILGRDPSFASLYLDDASVSGLHAAVIRQADGEYLIRDHGSVAGTWVNYDPVPAAGRVLEHGDLVQLGRVSLRFRSAHPSVRRTIRITALDASTPSQTGTRPK